MSAAAVTSGPSAGSPARFATGGRWTPESVSVVIPTVGRDALAAAVWSVLQQTAAVGEIIVAADTVGPLRLPNDPRIRVVRTGPGAGGNAARQRGIDLARGAIVALLDDDDTWLPDKVEAQLELLNAARPNGPWVLSCRVLATRSDGSQTVWPHRLIRGGEDVAEYMFVRHSLRHGHGFLQASGLMFPRELARRVTFRPDLRFHQDVTWLLDVRTAIPAVDVLQSPRALVRYTVADGSVSSNIRSAQSVEWALDHLRGHSARAMGDFLATQPVFYARRQGSLGDATAAVRAAFRDGRPSRRAAAYAAASLLVIAASAVRRCGRSILARCARAARSGRAER